MNRQIHVRIDADASAAVAALREFTAALSPLIDAFRALPMSTQRRLLRGWPSTSSVIASQRRRRS